jgi:nucleoside-diphosphate-sugar epimerase
MSVFKTSLKGAKVLVTGAGGFVGSHLIRRLVREGAEITAIDRKELKDTACSSVKEINADISDLSSVQDVLNGYMPDKVFHLAAYTARDRSMNNLNEAMKVNFTGTMNLLTALKDKDNNVDFDSFVFLGTAEAYGRNITPFTEKQQLDPVSPYSFSKAAAEMALQMYHRIYNVPVVILRCFVVYGPGQPGNMFFSELISAAMNKRDFKMTGGRQRRDFVYIDDQVEALILAATTQAAQGEILNVSSGSSCRIIDAVDIALDIMGNPIKPYVGALSYRDNELFEFEGDASKTAKILKWKAVVGLEEGLGKTVRYFIDRGEVA